MIGKVEKYDRRRGFGFINGDDGKKYFVPYCSVKTQSGVLEPGCTVEFNVGEGNKALNVRYF